MGAIGWWHPTAGSSATGRPVLRSAGNLQLNSPIVGMASTPDGRGYRMVAADGGIFNFGDAGFYGSAAGSTFLRGSPVVGMSATPDGGGYSVVAANGQDQAFGDAVWLPGGLITNVIGMTSDGGPTLQSLIGIATRPRRLCKGRPSRSGVLRTLLFDLTINIVCAPLRTQWHIESTKAYNP